MIDKNNIPWYLRAFDLQGIVFYSELLKEMDKNRQKGLQSCRKEIMLHASQIILCFNILFILYIHIYIYIYIYIHTHTKFIQCDV